MRNLIHLFNAEADPAFAPSAGSAAPDLPPILREADFDSIEEYFAYLEDQDWEAVDAARQGPAPARPRTLSPPRRAPKRAHGAHWGHP